MNHCDLCNFNTLTFGEAIAQGLYKNMQKWSKVGYTPTMNKVESDLWGLAGVYTFPVAATAMEVLSSNNVDDIGVVIKSGTSKGGTDTTLVDNDVDFTAATAVAVGDCVILDASSTHSEWGYVTGVTAHTLTFSDGFSHCGTGNARVYSVLDKSAKLGAAAVVINYLDGSYQQHNEIVVLNGTTAVATKHADLFRINSFRVIAAGSNAKPTGNITLRVVGGGTAHSFIPTGDTRASCIAYTIPLGKVLWVTSIASSFGITGTSKVEHARLYTRATQYSPESGDPFRTPGVFYSYSDMIATNALAIMPLLEPTALLDRVDIKVSGIATDTGSAFIVLRGYLMTMN